MKIICEKEKIIKEKMNTGEQLLKAKENPRRDGWQIKSDSPCGGFLFRELFVFTV